ncbi:MAG: PEGA domain-containing protein [Deltaproteobacteria bacterium]|nr:PEGA domain-containing protein [Deltaproteobacteria bacterium]
MSVQSFLVPVALSSALLVGCGAPQADLPPPKVAEPTLTQSQPEPPRKEHLATIEVLSSPAGMEVLLDSKPAGKTPVTIENLQPGSHDVTYKDEANGNATYSVEVGEGEYKVQKHNVVPRADRDAPANARQ